MSKKRKNNKRHSFISKLALLLVIVLVLAAGYDYYRNGNIEATLSFASRAEIRVKQLAVSVESMVRDALRKLRDSETEDVGSLAEIPEYAGQPYVTVNGNEPSFSEEELSAEPYETYSRLDILGRCGPAEAKLSREMMPTEERGDISEVRPSGWQNACYEGIDGDYLYNRCHLIGYQLAGENANEKNLITGTRYMNVEGMLPFEDEVADYIRMTDLPVMYRVTPVFEGADLVARGVQMEARSVEDDRVCFNVFVFNVQPGIGIDYGNGRSWKE